MGVPITVAFPTIELADLAIDPEVAAPYETVLVLAEFTVKTFPEAETIVASVTFKSSGNMLIVPFKVLVVDATLPCMWVYTEVSTAYVIVVASGTE